MDSTICKVHGHGKQVPPTATAGARLPPAACDPGDTGEVLHAHIRKGSANTARGAIELDADHRVHAVQELAIRDLKQGVGLNHCPSGIFNANAACLIAASRAHNLARWIDVLAMRDATPSMAKTPRRRLSRSRAGSSAPPDASPWAYRPGGHDSTFSTTPSGDSTPCPHPPPQLPNPSQGAEASHLNRRAPSPSHHRPGPHGQETVD